MDITRNCYTLLMADDDRINRKLTLEMLNYYSTALLWARLINIKAKRAM